MAVVQWRSASRSACPFRWLRPCSWSLISFRSISNTAEAANYLSCETQHRGEHTDTASGSVRAIVVYVSVNGGCCVCIPILNSHSHMIRDKCGAVWFSIYDMDAYRNV